MRVFIVRHGVTEETGKVLTGRLPGVALSAQGAHAAKNVGDHLRRQKWSAAYTSPIQRCKETAAFVTAPRRLKPKVNRGFIEADYGKWSGRKLSDLYKLKAWRDLMTHPSRFRFPEGETLGEVQRRSVTALESLAQTHGSTDVLVVSHSDVIRSLLCHYLGMPLDLIHRIHVSPTSLSIIELHSSGAIRVPVINQTFDGGLRG